MKAMKKENNLRKDITIKGMDTIWKKIKNGMLSFNKKKEQRKTIIWKRGKKTMGRWEWYPLATNGGKEKVREILKEGYW